MSETRLVDAGDLGVEELLAAVADGDRVIVRTELLGSDHELTLRRDGEVYYCDTPTRLHKHDSREAMRECIERQEYATA